MSRGSLIGTFYTVRCYPYCLRLIVPLWRYFPALEITAQCPTLSRQKIIHGETMVTPEDIKGWIEAGLPGSSVQCEGDGSHFEAVIVSPAFEGKTLVQKHQLVYAALGDKMKETIHALSMKTLTPAEAGQ